MIIDDEFRHLRECGAAWCTEADLARLLNKVDEAETKLAKSRAALKQMDCDCVLEMSPPEDHMKHNEFCDYRIARQTLKEIS